MNTLLLEKPRVDQRLITLTDLRREDLGMLAQKVSSWQQDPKFMRFLKEKPMSIQQNWTLFQKEMDTPHCVFIWIHLEWVADLVWFLLFHNFDSRDNSLELGFRIDPDDQSRGVCTQAVKKSLKDILSHDGVDRIVWWHSAFNAGSFAVFKKSGFQLEKFVPQQTFLPNLAKITDDFKWMITQSLLDSPNSLLLCPKEQQEILAWLAAHHLSL
jgi:RimJ/RimL family protein N-acetyltransferase